MSSVSRTAVVGVPPSGELSSLSFSFIDDYYKRNAARAAPLKEKITAGSKRKAESSPGPSRTKPKTAGELADARRASGSSPMPVIPVFSSRFFVNPQLAQNPLMPQELMYHPQNYISTLNELPPLIPSLTPELPHPPPHLIQEISTRKQFLQWLKWWKEGLQVIKEDRERRLGKRVRKYTAGAGLRKGKVQQQAVKVKPTTEKGKGGAAAGRDKKGNLKSKSGSALKSKSPASAGKKPANGKPRRPLPKEPIEDQLLPGWNVPPPEPCKEFFGAPVQEISYLLRTWDFLTQFRSLLGFEGIKFTFLPSFGSKSSLAPLDNPVNHIELPPFPSSSSAPHASSSASQSASQLYQLGPEDFQFPFPAFLSALFAAPSAQESVLLNIVFSALVSAAMKASASNELLVKTTMQKRRKNQAEERTWPMKVVNPLTWQEVLRFWISNAEEAKKNTELKVIAGFLGVDTFSQLEPKKRLTVLHALMDTITASNWIREECEKGNTEVIELKRRIKVERVNDRVVLKVAERNMPDVARTVAELVGIVEKHEEGKRNEPKGVIEEYRKVGMERLRATKDAAKAELDRQCAALLAKYPVRTEPLGEDRFYNRYWRLGESNQYLFVEQVDIDKENELNSQVPEVSAWGYYCGWAHMEDLANYLAPLGVREVDLQQAIDDVEWDFSRSAPFPECPDTRLASVSLGVYEQFELFKNQLRATAALVAISIEEQNSTEYGRCEICLEQIARDHDIHCPICHNSFSKGKNMEAFEAHYATCHESCTINIESAVEEADEEALKAGSMDEITINLAEKRDARGGRAGKRRFSESDSDSSDEEMAEFDEFNQPALERQTSAGTEAEAKTAQEAQPSGVKTESPAAGEAVKGEGEADQAASAAKSESKEGDESDGGKEKAAAPAKLLTLKRISPRFTCLADSTPQFRLLKSFLLDLEVAVHPVSLSKSFERNRKQWIGKAKLARSLNSLARSLIELQQNVRKEWLRDWFRPEEWLDSLKLVRTESQFAAALFAFDRALLYSEKEKQEEQIKIKERQENLDRSLQDGDDDDDWQEEGCRICRSTDKPTKILICDSCNLEYHTYCLKPALKSIPKGRWDCPKCADAASGRKSSTRSGSAKGGRKAGRPRKADREEDEEEEEEEEEEDEDTSNCRVCDKDEEDSLLIICDNCDGSFHLHCLTPPLNEVPEGDWYCEECQQRLKKEQETKLKRMGKKARERWIQQQPDREEAIKIVARLEAATKKAKSGSKGREEDQEAEMEIDQDGDGQAEAESDAESAPSEQESEDGLDRTLSASKQRKKASRREPESGSDQDQDAESHSATDDEDDGENEAEFNEGGQDDTDDDVCAVCFNGDSVDGNEIIYCDGDDMPVHIRCYGLAKVPEGTFICDRCEENIAPDSPQGRCVVCGQCGYFAKKIQSGEYAGQWIHLHCAAFTDGIEFEDMDRMDGITGLEQIEKSRWKQQCEICQKRVGFVVQCGEAGCKAKFHAICAAHNSEYQSPVHPGEDAESDPEHPFRCKAHARK